MQTLNFIISLSVLYQFSIQTAESCNGYTVKVNHAKNCMTGGVINLVGDNGATLDKDCNLAVTGCVEITKAFSKNLVNYTISKPPMPPIQGEVEGCEAIKNIKDPSILQTLKTFSVPTECPVKEGKICSSPENKLNISKYKNQLGMAAGTIDVRLETTHDVGKSCIEINFTLSKPRKAG